MPLSGGTPHEVAATELYTNFVLGLPGQTRVMALSTQGNEGTVVELGPDGSQVVVKPRGYRGRYGQPHAMTPDGKALVSVVTEGNIGNLWGSPLDGGPVFPITHFTDLLLANFAYARDGRLAVSRGSQNSDAVVATGLNVGHP
ncbi:MAG TPA: hypothetical protein VN515_02625 [Terriglobales bacterium]|nr:hypothetical protein [Terriglobales bacterium]